jgi:ABC-type dipeptide/oligopeptide/nickel transport system permease component
VRALLGRLARQLALLPLTAFAVYQLVALLPLGADSEAKSAQLRSVHLQLREDLGVGTPLGFLRPWERFVTGQSLDRAHTPTVDAGFVLRKLAGSLRIGGLALLLALLWGGAFAAARTLTPWPALGSLLDLGPAIVFGIPAFVLAIAVVLVTGQCLDPAEAWANEPAAALVASLGPGAFLGTLLRDALATELGRPYVTAARARGRSRVGALALHALPNALPVLLDALPPLATALLAGSFVAEKTFNLPYFGLTYVTAVLNKEILLVVIATTLFAGLLVLVSAVVELLKLAVDPRARAR